MEPLIDPDMTLKVAKIKEINASIEHLKDYCVSFDDVLIEPEYTEIESRNDVDTSVTIAGIKLSNPLVSSPMDTVTEANMAIAIRKLGGLGILHRFGTDKERLAMICDVLTHHQSVVYSVGASLGEIRFMDLVEEEFGHSLIDAVCIDLANDYFIELLF